MPNSRSAAKRVRQTAKRTERNKRIKSQVRTAIRRFEEALTSDATQADAKLRVAVKTIDKAASKGVMHKNKAARQKSRLVKRLHKIQEA